MRETLALEEKSESSLARVLSNTPSFSAAIKSVESGKNSLILGQRGIGKSWLLRQAASTLLRQKTHIPVIIDAAQAVTSPEEFAIELIKSAYAWINDLSLKDYRTLSLGKIKTEAQSKNCLQAIYDIENELQKIKPNHMIIVESAFRFVQEAGKDSGSRIALMIDNCHELLSLNNYPQIRDIVSTINNMQLRNVAILAATSDAQSARAEFRSYERIELVPLDNKKTSELVSLTAQSAGVQSSKSEEEKIFLLSGGIPLAAAALARSLVGLKKENGDKKNKEIESSALTEEFVANVLTLGRELNTGYSSALAESLSRARGQNLLMSVLRATAFSKEMRLSDIARRIYRSAPVTKSLLERLIAVGLVVKNDSRYLIPDLALRTLIKNSPALSCVRSVPSEIIKDISSELEKELGGVVNG